jgi:uncharacterized membrane protein YkvA (DUF1232 family)
VTDLTDSAAALGARVRKATRGRTGPRRGAKRTLMGTIRQLPLYLKMFLGLFRDARVSTVDKVLVGAAIAYLIAPVDLIADFIPFLGQVDDVFLLSTSLKRLLQNAGRRVVAEHWAGDMREISEMQIDRVIAAAAFFLPGRLRRRLRMIGRV